MVVNCIESRKMPRVAVANATPKNAGDPCGEVVAAAVRADKRYVRAPGPLSYSSARGLEAAFRCCAVLCVLEAGCGLGWKMAQFALVCGDCKRAADASAPTLLTPPPDASPRPFAVAASDENAHGRPPHHRCALRCVALPSLPLCSGVVDFLFRCVWSLPGLCSISPCSLFEIEQRTSPRMTWTTLTTSPRTLKARERAAVVASCRGCCTSLNG